MPEAKPESLIVPKDGVKIAVKTIHQNVSPSLILITEDRLSLLIHRHSDGVNKKNEWIAPLGVFLTIAITLTTADFKSFILPRVQTH